MVKQRSHGLNNWMWQRITAAIMVLYVTATALRIGSSAPFTAASWKAFFTPPLFKLLTLLFILSLLYHAWLGIKQIFMDYVHNNKLGSALETMVTLAVASYACWATLIVWNI